MSGHAEHATTRVDRSSDPEHRARTTPVAVTWDYIAFSSLADFDALRDRYEFSPVGVTGMIPATTPFAWMASAEQTTHLILATEREPATGARRTGDDRGWIAPTDLDDGEVGRVFLAGPRYAVATVSQALQTAATTIHGPAQLLGADGEVRR